MDGNDQNVNKIADSEAETAEEFGEEQDKVVKVAKEPSTIPPMERLKFAKVFMAFMAILYILIAGLNVCSESLAIISTETAKSVWSHFSQFSTNAIMLVLGYYFATSKK